MLRYRSPRDAMAIRRLLRRAADHGYELGAHCLGGAYAVGRGLLSRQDLLEWEPWAGDWISEDVVIGVLTVAAGLAIRGSVEPGRCSRSPGRTFRSHRAV